jgi:glycosyltransferase involved in cell wall biosynthesis
MKKKLILSFSLGRSGGSLKYAQELLDAMEIINARVVAFTNIRSKVAMPKTKKKLYVYDGKFSFVVSSLLLLPLYLLMLFLFFSFCDRKNIVIHFPYFHYWSVPITIVAKFFNIDVVSTVHDGVLHLGDGKPFEQFLNKMYVANASKLIFLTEFVRDNVKEKIPFTATSIISPHGIIGDDYGFDARNKKSRKNILFFGRISKYKGVESLLKALNGVPPDCFDKLFIVGKSQYKVDYSEFNHKDKLMVVDEYVSECDIKRYFDLASILVLPYIEATQSGVAMLGVASATPMIISDCGGLTEQLSMCEALFYDAESDGSLTECITKLLTDDSLYSEIHNNLLGKRQELSWESISRRIMEFIYE